jgi:hypothetical protein
MPLDTDDRANDPPADKKARVGGCDAPAGAAASPAAAELGKTTVVEASTVAAAAPPKPDAGEAAVGAVVGQLAAESDVLIKKQPAPACGVATASAPAPAGGVAAAGAPSGGVAAGPGIDSKGITLDKPGGVAAGCDIDSKGVILLNTLEKPEGTTMHLFKDGTVQVKVPPKEKGAKAKHIPSCTLYTAMYGKTSASSKWREIEYNPMPKTCILMNGEVTTVEKAMGTAIQHIYGKGNVKEGFPQKCINEGVDTELFWEPALCDEKVVNALIACESPGLIFFSMSTNIVGGVTFLVPDGIAWCATRPIKLPDNDGERVVKLTPS